MFVWFTGSDGGGVKAGRRCTFTSGEQEFTGVWYFHSRRVCRRDSRCPVTGSGRSWSSEAIWLLSRKSGEVFFPFLFFFFFLRCFKEQYMFTHLPTCNTPELRYFYMHKYVCDTLENILLKYYFFFSFFSVHWTCQLAVSCCLPLTLNLTRWVQVSIQSKWVVRYRACFWKYKNMTKYELEYGFEKKNVWK